MHRRQLSAPFSRRPPDWLRAPAALTGYRASNAAPLRCTAALAFEAAMALSRHATFFSLPPPVSRHVFSLVPVDSRLRCAEVCRAWRAALADRSLWKRLDMSRASGVSTWLSARAWLSLLRCAVARAGGELEELDATGGRGVVLFEELQRMVSVNAGALRVLRVTAVLSPEQVAVVARAAPVVEVFEVSRVFALNPNETLHQMLRNEAPMFAPLRMLELHYQRFGYEGEAGVVALAAGVAAHASLQSLDLHGAALGTAAALDALVDAAILRRLHTLECWNCGLTAASLPSLARLVEAGVLTVLKLDSLPTSDALLDVPGSALLGAALRGNACFTELHVECARLWDSVEAGVTLVNALVGHQSLKMLRFVMLCAYGDEFGGPAPGIEAAGRAFGALVAANAPALRYLYIPGTALGDAGLAPIFAALASNTHLQTLDCSETGLSEAFVRGTVLPAVRANQSLRDLRLGLPFWASAAEAERHVRGNLRRT